MRRALLMGLAAAALIQVLAWPGRAPAEAKRDPAVVAPLEPPPPRPIQVIRRVKVEKTLPIEPQTAAQPVATGKAAVKQSEKGKK